MIKRRNDLLQKSQNLPSAILKSLSREVNIYPVPTLVGSAQRVGFFNIGSGRVLDKIPGSGSGSGRVGVSKYMIGYIRVSFLLSGISGYFGYFRVCWVFPGLPIYTRVFSYI